jgi:hypothetical protein
MNITHLSFPTLRFSPLLSRLHYQMPFPITVRTAKNYTLRLQTFNLAPNGFDSAMRVLSFRVVVAQSIAKITRPY